MIANRNFELAAGASTQVTIKGNFIRCLSSSAQLLQIQTETIEGSGSTFEIESGIAFDTKTFSSFRVTNTGIYTAQCKFVVSDEGFVYDGRLTGNLDLIGAINVLSSLPAHSEYRVVVAKAGEDVVPVNLSRRWCRIKMDTKAAATVLSNGYVISNGEDLDMEWLTTSALTVGAGASNRTFYVWENFD